VWNRSPRSPSLSSGNPACALSSGRADQHHRADDKARGEQDARRDNFLAERIAEEDRDQRIDVVLRRRDVVAGPELGKIAAKIPPKGTSTARRLQARAGEQPDRKSSTLRLPDRFSISGMLRWSF